MLGTGRDVVDLHMNEHIAGALEDPVHLIIDVRLPRCCRRRRAQ